MLRFSLMPREAKFFGLFEESATNMVKAAEALEDLFQAYEKVPEKVKQITDLEHQGDAFTHQIMELLHRTFVTPLDREDIVLLTHSLDDVVDFIEGAAYAMLLYRIPQPTKRSQELAAIVLNVAKELEEAIARLRQRAKLREILKYCVEINRLENEADRVLRSALAELFEDTNDMTAIIKWREIYEQLEGATDKGEDVANVLEGVVLKHA